MEITKLKAIIDFHEEEYGFINHMKLEEEDMITIDNRVYMILDEMEADDVFFEYHWKRKEECSPYYETIAEHAGIEKDDFAGLVDHLQETDGRGCLAIYDGVEHSYQGYFIYILD